MQLLFTRLTLSSAIIIGTFSLTLPLKSFAQAPSLEISQYPAEVNEKKNLLGFEMIKHGNGWLVTSPSYAGWKVRSRIGKFGLEIWRCINNDTCWLGITTAKDKTLDLYSPDFAGYRTQVNSYQIDCYTNTIQAKLNRLTTDHFMVGSRKDTTEKEFLPLHGQKIQLTNQGKFSIETLKNHPDAIHLQPGIEQIWLDRCLYNRVIQEQF